MRMVGSTFHNEEAVQLMEKLKTAAEARKPKEAIKIFREMKAKKIPRTEGSYVLLLDSLQKSSDVQNIDLLFVSMKKEAVRATDIFYSKIIAAYGHCGAFDKVGHVLIDMDGANVKPGPLTLSALLAIKKWSGEIEEAKELYQTIRNNDYPVKPQDLNIMLSIYLSEGNVPGVLEIVKEFRDNSYKPEERPFRDIIKVHLLAKDYERARQVISVMRQFEVPITGSTYSLFIEYLVSNVLIAGSSPDELPLSAAPDPTLLTSTLSTIRKLLGEMRNNKITPSRESYEALINLFCSEDPVNPTTLNNILQEAKEHGVQLTLTMFNLIIRAFVKHSPEHIPTILKEMADAGVKPDQLTYALMLSAEGDNNFRYVEEVTKTLKEDGVKPGYHFYWQYIRLAVKNGEDAKAAVAISEMQENGIQLDKNIMTILLRRMIKRGSLPTAKKMLEELLSEQGGSITSKQTVNQLMASLYLQRDYKALLELIKTVIAQEQGLDISILNRPMFIKLIRDWQEINNGDLHAIELYTHVEADIHETLKQRAQQLPHIDDVASVSKVPVSATASKVESEGTPVTPDKLFSKFPKTTRRVHDDTTVLGGIYKAVVPVLHSVPMTATEKQKLDRFSNFFKENTLPLPDTVREKFNEFVRIAHKRISGLKAEEKHKYKNTPSRTRAKADEVIEPKKREKRVYTKENRETLKAQAILRKQLEKKQAKKKLATNGSNE